MTAEIKETSALPQTGIRQELIDNIQELARLDPPVREALFGSLTDHLVRVCRGRFPNSLLVSDSYCVGAISQQVQVDELRMDPPGRLWSMFLEATRKQLPEFKEMKPEKKMSAVALGRVFLRSIDSTWAGGSFRRLPDMDDWSRYKSRRDLVTSETGLPFGAIRHLELVGARVVIGHYASKLGWGTPEITNLTSRLVQELQVGGEMNG